MAPTDPSGKSAPTGGFKDLGFYSGFQYYKGSFAPTAGSIHPQSPQVGAGQKVSSEVNRASAQAQGVSEQEFQGFLSGQKQFEDKSQANNFLNKFQDTLSVPEGLKAPSFKELTAQLKPSVGLPDPFSRIEEFERRRDELGVADLEKQLNELKGQEDEAYTQLRINVAGERGKPVALGVIEGRVSEQERTARENIEFIQRQKSRVVDELNTANNVISLYVQLGGDDYADAVNRYNGEFTRNLQTYELFRGLRKDEMDFVQQQRANALANLQIYTNAITSGNLNPSSISGSDKLMINKLEVQSGLPMGFVQSLQMSAKDRLIDINEQTGEALVIGNDGNYQIIQTGFRGSTSTGSDTKNVRAQFTESAKTSNFPDLVNEFAKKGMSLDDIYKAYANSDAGRNFGSPKENSFEIQLLYKVAKGEITPEEARLKLE